MTLTDIVLATIAAGGIFWACLERGRANAAEDREDVLAGQVESLTAELTGRTE